MSDSTVNLDPYADIPPEYGVTHYPSIGKAGERWLPTYKGRYIAMHFGGPPPKGVDPLADPTTMTTTTDAQCAIACHEFEQAIAVIREHMSWRPPKVLHRQDWPLPKEPQRYKCGTLLKEAP